MKKILFVSFVLFVQSAFAWGPQGHMVVAQVAELNLTPTAKKALNQILEDRTLPDVANWADSIKGNPAWAHTKPWHYVDIPDGEDYSTIEHTHDGDVVAAITDMVEVLKNKDASADEKENALKFIVHFVGDVHQPLHVGKPDDHGGNSLKVTFEGRSTNLHSLWDSILIMKNRMDHIQYAAWLESHMFVMPPYDIPEMPFSKIIAECMDARGAIYDFKPNAQNRIILDTAYYTKNVDLMNQQLLTGGRRLAFLLNSIYK